VEPADDPVSAELHYPLGNGLLTWWWTSLSASDHLHLIPRSKPNFQLPGGSKLEVNSLAFAGMLLVKSDEELELLNKTTETNENGGTQGLMRVLEHCGVPRAWGEWEEAAEGTLAEPVQQQL
jgi:ATP adenylyltransferase